MSSGRAAWPPGLSAARAEVYAALSALLGDLREEPDRDASWVVESLGRSMGALESMGYRTGPLRELITRLVVDPPSASRLRQERARASERCRPRESYFVESGDYSRLALSELARSAGVESLDLDSLSGQLGLMYVLAYQQELADASADRERVELLIRSQLSLLERHLLRWVPRLAECVIREVGEGMYSLALAALLQFIEDDRQALINSPRP